MCIPSTSVVAKAWLITHLWIIPEICEDLYDVNSEINSLLYHLVNEVFGLGSQHQVGAVVVVWEGLRRRK